MEWHMMTHVMLFLLIVGKGKIAQDAFMILVNSLSPPSHPQCLTMWFRQRRMQFRISVLTGLRDVMWPTAFSTDRKWSCRFERIRCIWTSDAIAVPCKTEGFRCVDCRKGQFFPTPLSTMNWWLFTTNGQL